MSDRSNFEILESCLIMEKLFCIQRLSKQKKLVLKVCSYLYDSYNMNHKTWTISNEPYNTMIECVSKLNDH